MRCVFADGTVIDGSADHAALFWGLAIAIGAVLVVALALELTALRHPTAPRRTARLASAAAVVLLFFHLARALLGRYGADVCRGVGGLQEGNLREVERSFLTPQTTCVFHSGDAYHLLPTWLLVVWWTAVAVFLLAVAGCAVALRHRRAAAPAAPPEEAASGADTP
ncbi:hypothetical protein [Streptomyces sp. NPDC049881]|uniref:hypothetical protein n=1 Tax=Streptomyces sp. NPDC049881 TaxID=3155778 RepID=UPI0034222BF0